MLRAEVQKAKILKLSDLVEIEIQSLLALLITKILSLSILNHKCGSWFNKLAYITAFSVFCCAILLSLIHI